ncbi:hypothetical protein HYK36_004259 [Salmonella enterica]|nr:hypothetical protein [Salmonella enterica]
MKFIISNKHITFTLLFLFLLCVFGGKISALVINETALVQWLSENRINNVFTGADFSILPAVTVLAVIYLLSAVLHSILVVLLDLWDYLTTPPAVTPESKTSAIKQAKSTEESSKPEPTLGELPVDDKSTEPKDKQP